VWAAYPNASVELITASDAGAGLVAVQWVMRGTNTGPLPDGTPATGRPVTLRGASFTQVEGDKIRSEQIYFDRQTLLEQLGLKAR
jgi:predicted ester cyclase